MATKLFPDPDETDQLIIDTIRQIQKSKKRAFSDLVCKKLSKDHGLEESIAMLQLTSLLAMKKIENIPTKDGLESLKINESKVKLSIKSQVEDSKGRKLSNDEDRIIKCRNELQTVAETERLDIPEISKSCGSICDTDSVQSRSDLEEEVKCLHDGLDDGKKCGSKKDDLQGENDINLKRDLAQQSLNIETEIDSVETKKRLEILEGQISNILDRLDNQDAERWDSRQIRQKDFQEMSAKIRLLERQNKALSDENLALRLENSKINKFFLNKGVYKNDIKSKISQFTPKKCSENFYITEERKKTAQRENPWNFPKKTVRQQQEQQHVPKQVIYKNRFSVLEDLEDGGEGQNEWQEEREYPWGAERQEKLYSESLGTQQQWSTNQRVIEDGTHQVASSFVRTMGTMHKAGMATSETNAFQNVQRGSNTNTYRKPTLCIVGDSMIKSLNRRAINQAIRSHDVHLKTFGGAKIEDMRDYVVPTLRTKPETLILHCGTNNLKNENEERIANKIIALAVDIKKNVPNVAVSGIVFRADSQMEHKIRRVNYLVEVGVKEYDIAFISQDNIEAGHLDKWGLHLNFYGTNVLAGNFVNFVTSN